MNKIVKKGQKTEIERKSSKKNRKIEIKKEKKMTKTKKIDRTQLKTMVGIYNAAETGAMKLV